ncbi:uncharacterized protein [Chelonus insularis]|uniref:uncharacterized protein isoform X2 n=1 Tax=Chelonus insularis TaxID=460826 RepID=UPI00158D4EDF|nr:uncharacterized protein LOC118064484 isoform X2 [Chelonus insularis]
MKYNVSKKFNYVLKKQEKNKICFGSGKSRDLGLKSGMNTFMRYHISENYPNIGPQKYNVLESFKAITSKPCSKSFSKKGYGGLTNSSCRRIHVDDYPAPNEYNVSFVTVQNYKFKHPLASKTKRKTFEVNNNPDPTTYQRINLQTRGMLFDHNFGCGIKMRFGVEIKCTKRNTDVCKICNESLSGDYWHLNNKKFICRPCMMKERKRLQKYKKEELNQFRKIRDCSWIHSHGGTDAKVWLIHPKDIQKWAQREAYISSYIKD